MTATRIAALIYKADAANGITFDNPDPISGTEPAFDWKLAEGIFTAHMRLYFRTADDARVPVGAFLNAWEIGVGVERGRAEIRFRYQRAEMAALPETAGRYRLHAGTGNYGYGAGVAPMPFASGTGTVLTVSRKYPEPLGDFAVTPLVEMLWRSFDAYASGRERFLSMTNFCLTAIEAECGAGRGKRARAAARFRISGKVLKTIGELSERGGPDARKVAPNSIPLIPEEKEFLEAAICAVIRHIGELAAGAQGVEELDLGHLPKLPDRAPQSRLPDA